MVKKQQLERCMEQLIGSGLKKEYDRAVCCQPVLFNLHAEHIMRNAEWNELQAGIKIGREISTTSDKRLLPLEWLKVKRNSRAS